MDLEMKPAWLNGTRAITKLRWAGLVAEMSSKRKTSGGGDRAPKRLASKAGLPAAAEHPHIAKIVELFHGARGSKHNLLVSCQLVVVAWPCDLYLGWSSQWRPLAQTCGCPMSSRPRSLVGA